MLNRRQFIAGAAAAAAAGLKAATPAPAPPSVILIAIEDLGAWMTSIQGAKNLKTPNLDAIARSGTRFVHAFSASPVPQAGFDSLITGASPMQAGAATPLDKLLSARGYRTASFGGGDVASINRQTLEFLDQQKSGQRFCAIVRYAPLRETSKVAAKYTQAFANDTFVELGWLPAVANATDKQPFASIVPHLREAAAAVAAFDDQLPSLTAKLYERGLADNTLVVIAGTNGVLLGRHGLWGDGRASTPPNMFDEVVGVPLIWNWASGAPSGGLRPEVVSLFDVVPTICQLTGATAPQATGRSLVRAVLGQKYPKKQTWDDRAYAVLEGTTMARNSRYKVVVRGGVPSELYDLSSDPGEQVNRVEDTQFLGVRADLSREVSNWK